MTQLQTISRALRDTIGSARVTHALFTTYAFEAAFFEAHIVPQLCGPIEGMSIHEGVRRLQLNEKLCATPVGERPQIEVFIDGRLQQEGVPWLPYDLHAVRMKGAFHGKIILLRLESQGKRGTPEVSWVLGCGSANLTLAAWWENVETWSFTPSFLPNAVPVHVHKDINGLLGWLRATAPNNRHPVLNAWDADHTRATHDAGGPRFAAFYEGSPRFIERFRAERKKSRSTIAGSTLEVVSPYFCEHRQGEFAESVRSSLGVDAIDVWLPLDVWDHCAGLLTRPQFDSLKQMPSIRWASLISGAPLQPVSAPDDPARNPRRFTHAKVIRVPGELSFIGSVNFSRAAFDGNFEAGFFFDDTRPTWLEPTNYVPEAFLLESVSPGEEGAEELGGPAFDAVFDWKTHILTVFLIPPDDIRYASAVLEWQRGNGQGTLYLELGKPCHDAALIENFGIQPTINIDWHLSDDEHGTVAVWVHQEHLDWRPVPEELKLDVWSMIELWRSTQGERIGCPGVLWERLLQSIELQEQFAPDAPVCPPAHEDIFARMTNIHGAFQGLRERIQQDEQAASSDRTPSDLARYYLCTERTDSLSTMLSRMEANGKVRDYDAVEQWVILQWIKQIAAEHPGLGDAIDKRADSMLDTLEQEALRSVPAAKRQWLKAAFLGQLAALDANHACGLPT